MRSLHQKYIRTGSANLLLRRTSTSPLGASASTYAMGAVSCRWLTISILCCSSVSALPLAAPSADSSLGLEFPLAFCPLIVLLLFKMAYIEYRRSSSTPGQRAAERTAGLSLAFRIGSFNVYLKLVRTAYLVGFLGSPAWETRTPGSTDRVSLQPHGTSTFNPSPALDPRPLGNESHVVPAIAQHRTSRLTPNHGAHRKHDGDVYFTSCAGIQSSIREHRNVAPSLSLLAPVHLPSRSEVIPPQWPSPSLTQVMEPIISAVVSKAPTSRVQLLAEGGRVYSTREGSLGESAPLASVQLLILPTSVSCLSGSSVRTLTTDMHAGNDDAGYPDTSIVSVRQGIPIALPPSIHHISRPRSRDCIPEEWECNRLIPAVTQRTTHALKNPRTTKETMCPSLSLEIKAPLSLTTRPLNGVTESDCSSSSIPAAELPILVLAGRRLTPKSKVLRKRSSDSPQIGPSPLRNSFLLDSSASVSTVDETRPNSTDMSICSNWALDDLLVDGQLDINAVTAALGLGLSMGLGEGTEDGDSVTATVSYSDSTAHHNPDSGGLALSGWDAIVPTSLEVHVPCAQLTTIPEEAEDVSSLELSPPFAATSLCSRSTFIRLSDISGDFFAELSTARTIASVYSSRSHHDISEEYWQDERSWKDGAISRQ